MTSNAKQKYTYKDIKATYKTADAVWTVFAVDPLVTPIIYLVSNFTKLSPTFFTFLGLFLSAISSACFIQGTKPYLIAGAILFELAFWSDCIDGKLARLTGNSSAGGAFFELLFDQFRLLLIVLGIAYGQFRITGDYVIIIMSLVYIIFHFFWMSLWYIYTKANKIRLLKYNPSYTEDPTLSFKKKLIMKNIKPKGLRNIIGFYALKHRVLSRYSSVEIDTIVFIFAPIFLEPKTGFIIGIILWTALTIFKVLDFSLTINKPPKFMDESET